MGGGAEERVIIVGAGLAGALLACSLAGRGYRITLFERRPDPRCHSFIGGRSINLALSTRGITALKEVGLADRVLAHAIPMPGRMIHGPRGTTVFQPYSANPNDAINSVSRGGLNIALIDEADSSDRVTIGFNQRCIGVDLDRLSATFQHEETGEESIHPADWIAGADGAFSAVREAMRDRMTNFDCSQSFLGHGYKELSIPPAESGDFAMEPNALHIWPRGGAMMIALPNADHTFTCTLFWPLEGAGSFASIRSKDEIVPFFEKHYPDAVPLMPTLVEDYETNPIGLLATVRCGPWFYEDKVLLIGDAAHAIVPFFGQGMNAAFEDCRILAVLLREGGTDRARVFERFFAERKANTDAIADLALANFIEMRDKTASPAFRFRKKIEQALHRLVPQWFVPLYNLVSFTNVPYAEARARARKQWRVVALIAALAAVCFVVVAGVFIVAIF